MLTSFFADLYPAIARSISASLQEPIQREYGFLTDFANREAGWD
jgi:hypothetical protein